MADEKASQESTSGRRAQPQSEHDWIIHSLNIHGTFFERFCARLITAKEPHWHLEDLNFPVRVGEAESASDIVAVARHAGAEVTAIIECKKANPELAKWIFARKAFRREIPSNASFHVVENKPDSRYSRGWAPYGSLGLLTWPGMVVCDDGREVREDYRAHQNQRDKTKTANAAISDAATQVALATKCIVEDNLKVAQELANAAKAAPYRVNIFVPVIVTTAQLFALSFEPADVSSTTGEIPYDKASLASLPYLLLEYPLPRRLQFPSLFVPETLARIGSFPGHGYTSPS